MAVNENYTTRKVEFSTVNGLIEYCRFMVGADKITQYDMDEGDVHEVWELRVTGVLKLRNLPEMSFQTFAPNDLDYSASMAQFWAEAKTLGQAQGGVSGNAADAVLLLVEFLNLVDTSSGLGADFSVAFSNGQTFGVSVIGRLRRHLNYMLASLNRGAYNPQDVIFWLEDTIKYPTEVSSRFDPYAWMY